MTYLSLDSLMTVEAESGVNGDTTILHSPVQEFLYPTVVSFLLDMKVESSDVTTKFKVYVTWQGMTFDPVLSINQPQDNVRHEFCMPPGEFSLKFVFTVGRSFKPSVAMDKVVVEPALKSPWNGDMYTRNDFSTSREAFQYMESFRPCKQTGTYGDTCVVRHAVDFNTIAISKEIHPIKHP